MNTFTRETKLTLFYILFAFTFSVLMRLIWVYQFSGTEAFIFNDQFMINTNDGYTWAEGARDLVSGISQPNDYSPIGLATSQLTAFMIIILPFTFETIIFYLPVFLSSLVVIPIILISKVLKNLEMGLIAALLASIAWSYYNRTMSGYFDNDMLNIVLPMFLLWSIIWAVQTKQNIYLLLTALDILVYRWWYPQSYSLEFSFFGLILVYTLIFDKKNIFNYKLLAIMMFAMMDTSGYIRLGLVGITFYIFSQNRFDKYIYYILALAIVSFFISGGFNPIWAKLSIYVFTDSIISSDEGLKLHFFAVMQTVREAGHIPFETFANRISGHTITFVLSLLGYLYLSYKHKIMLLALPLVGLGFLAIVGGLRFTIYAVPILALGIAFLITEISKNLPTQKMKILSMILFTLAILYPNYKHIEAYKVPTVFNSTEVKALDKMKSIADREDYMIAWWDYGYPIRYYADVKTLSDGSQHEGHINFPVSYMLINTQEKAAKMARLAVEYTESNFESNRTGSTIEQMTLDYAFKDTNKFLSALKSNIKLPKKTRDIYIYLPYRMLNIVPTVALFSHMDLMTGKKKQNPFFYVSRQFKDSNSKIDFGRGIVLDKTTSNITVGTQVVPINRFVKTSYDKDMKLHTDVQVINTTANINVIFMSNYNTFLILDEKMYNSLYIQLMVLENVNSELFEAVILNPNVKIYKLKV
ncbi:peptide transporter [Sulfurimonas sp. SAG-AH-194-C21]|nr:STT3 domain-containing protein [Sulfurimonas sp. SAG-AH-194-C21]MDF1884358.1 peptide transporter [Sulfurimonas sp. SAG-AH-194-C21]